MQNTHDKKQRLVRKTALVYGEGSDDKCWLNYLKQLFVGEKTIKILSGGGGSPNSVILRMTNHFGFRDYTVKIALLDTDRKEFNIATDLASQHAIKIIPSNGCLELEMLELGHIIHPQKISSASLKRARISSQQAKSEFEKVCKHDDKSYAKLFPKDVLNEARSKSKWLNTILVELEGI